MANKRTLVGKVLSLPITCVTFFQSTVLSSRAVIDGHQMYFADSVVGKASTAGVGISPTPPLIFTGQKVRNLTSFSATLNFEPSACENAARYPNYETKV